MTRNVKAPALVLKINPVGENHRGLSMLVSGEGLLRPLAFGAQGRRSSLRGTAVPYNRGIADLHYDGAKHNWRLTAFDPEDTHDGLRENLDRFYAVAVWAEILLNTHGGGGESAALFDLAAAGFSLMADAEGEAVDRLNTAFLWNFLGIEGVRPDPDRCGRCGRVLGRLNPESTAAYRPDGLLVGPECRESNPAGLPDGARRWLGRISDGNLAAAMKLGLPPAALAAAERWLLVLIQTLLERPLRSRRI